MYLFEKGKAYFATPTIPEQKQIVVACTGVHKGRDGKYATFARIDMLKRVKVCAFEQREMVQLKCNTGIDYTVSAACEADVGNAAQVLATMEGR